MKPTKATKASGKILLALPINQHAKLIELARGRSMPVSALLREVVEQLLRGDAKPARSPTTPVSYIAPAPASVPAPVSYIEKTVPYIEKMPAKEPEPYNPKACIRLPNGYLILPDRDREQEEREEEAELEARRAALGINAPKPALAMLDRAAIPTPAPVPSTPPVPPVRLAPSPASRLADFVDGVDGGNPSTVYSKPGVLPGSLAELAGLGAGASLMPPLPKRLDLESIKRVEYGDDGQPVMLAPEDGDVEDGFTITPPVMPARVLPSAFDDQFGSTMGDFPDDGTPLGVPDRTGSQSG